MLKGKALLLPLSVLVVELIDTTGSINELYFPCKERVRLAADFQLHNRIFIAILKNNSFFGVCT
jgi:hypothetical protein